MTLRRRTSPLAVALVAAALVTAMIDALGIDALGIDALGATEVTVEPSDHGAVVKVDGQLFAEYRTGQVHQPAVWPIVGPTGKPVTRSFPLGPRLDSEEVDHPHHHSLWFSHEDVNGHNFWLEPRKGTSSDQANVIKHLGFDRMEADGGRAVLVTRNRWLAGADKPVCDDERTLVFCAEEESRWIDFTIKISAKHGPVTFGDIKDGSFSTRVAGTIKVDSGGTLVNSRGRKNADAWGMPAEWIDNYGPLDGETVGLAMFSHPTNFRHPTRWHVRNYGLLCANPFGERQFPKSDLEQSNYTIASGESLTLRYRVYLHRGDTAEGQVADAYREFAAEGTSSGRWPIVFQDDFEAGMEHWVVSDARLPGSVWGIESSDDQELGNYLRAAAKSPYQPPFRSPHGIALIKDCAVSDFELNVKVQNTNVNAGPHRDLCFFWGYQDPAHFYYAHLGAKPDPHSSQIFIVDGAPRKMITRNESPGIPWTEGWHKVRVSYRSKMGEMEIFFDDMQTPVFVANDKTFTWGRVGIGTFDDHGNFDDVRLRGKLIDPIPAEAKLP